MGLYPPLLRTKDGYMFAEASSEIEINQFQVTWWPFCVSNLRHFEEGSYCQMTGEQKFIFKVCHSEQRK